MRNKDYWNMWKVVAEVLKFLEEMRRRNDCDVALKSRLFREEQNIVRVANVVVVDRCAD